MGRLLRTDGTAREAKLVEGHWTSKLSHDELFTVVVEVEATINSRPISYLSSEDVDEPSHLLVGRCLLNLPDSVNCETDPDFGTNLTELA